MKGTETCMSGMSPSEMVKLQHQKHSRYTSATSTVLLLCRRARANVTAWQKRTEMFHEKKLLIGTVRVHPSCALPIDRIDDESTYANKRRWQANE